MTWTKLENAGKALFLEGILTLDGTFGLNRDQRLRVWSGLVLFFGVALHIGFVSEQN